MPPTTFTIDTDTPEGRHAAATLGINTLGASPTSLLPGIKVSMPGSGVGVDPNDENSVLGLYKEASGFQRDKLAQDAKSAKDNLDYNYANMRQQAKTAQDKLAVDRWYQQQQVRLADQTHALAVRSEGASEAKTMTDYLSGPDTMFQARQLGRSLYALNNGVAAPAYGYGGDTPQPRTEAGFQGIMGQGTSTVNPDAKAQPDGRIAAAAGIVKALPPSGTPGMSTTDNTAMNTLSALYSSPAEGADMNAADQEGTQFLNNGPGNVALGTYQSLLPGTKAALGSLAKTKGVNFDDWNAQWKRYQPGQGSVTGA
jgi:hypothetical protein